MLRLCYPNVLVLLTAHIVSLSDGCAFARHMSSNHCHANYGILGIYIRFVDKSSSGFAIWSVLHDKELFGGLVPGILLSTARSCDSPV